MGEDTCKEHSGFCAHIKNIEADVRDLFTKWDGVQKLLVGTLVSTLLSLIGILVILVSRLAEGGC